MKIQVYGPGCRKCRRTEKVVRETLDSLGVEADVEKVEDYQAIMAAGVLGTPAVAVDGEVKVSGRVPKPAEIEGWLKA
ncbi:MAG: thioredoxin family protein [Myxococcota bacterium]